MIRMNRVMLARSRAETDALLGVLDPAGTLALRALISATREANGALPFREHDFQAILERLRRAGEAAGRPPDGSVTAEELAQAIQDAGG
jgi:hypothetical protein